MKNNVVTLKSNIQYGNVSKKFLGYNATCDVLMEECHDFCDYFNSFLSKNTLFREHLSEEEIINCLVIKCSFPDRKPAFYFSKKYLLAGILEKEGVCLSDDDIVLLNGLSEDDNYELIRWYRKIAKEQREKLLGCKGIRDLEKISKKLYDKYKYEQKINNLSKTFNVLLPVFPEYKNFSLDNFLVDLVIDYDNINLEMGNILSYIDNYQIDLGNNAKIDSDRLNLYIASEFMKEAINTDNEENLEFLLDYVGEYIESNASRDISSRSSVNGDTIGFDKLKNTYDSWGSILKFRLNCEDSPRQMVKKSTK